VVCVKLLYQGARCNDKDYVAYVSVPLNGTAVCLLYKSALSVQATVSLADLQYRRLAGPPLLGDKKVFYVGPNPLPAALAVDGETVGQFRDEVRWELL
jgi:hypothetical protein